MTDGLEHKTIIQADTLRVKRKREISTYCDHFLACFPTSCRNNNPGRSQPLKTCLKASPAPPANRALQAGRGPGAGADWRLTGDAAPGPQHLAQNPCFVEFKPGPLNMRPRLELSRGGFAPASPPRGGRRAGFAPPSPTKQGVLRSPRPRPARSCAAPFLRSGRGWRSPRPSSAPAGHLPAGASGAGAAAPGLGGALCLLGGLCPPAPPLGAAAPRPPWYALCAQAPTHCRKRRVAP